MEHFQRAVSLGVVQIFAIRGIKSTVEQEANGKEEDLIALIAAVPDGRGRGQGRGTGLWALPTICRMDCRREMNHQEKSQV
jgi:hypothetical protein